MHGWYSTPGRARSMHRRTIRWCQRTRARHQCRNAPHRWPRPTTWPTSSSWVRCSSQNSRNAFRGNLRAPPCPGSRMSWSRPTRSRGRTPCMQCMTRRRAAGMQRQANCSTRPTTRAPRRTRWSRRRSRARHPPWRGAEPRRQRMRYHRTRAAPRRPHRRARRQDPPARHLRHRRNPPSWGRRRTESATNGHLCRCTPHTLLARQRDSR